MECLTLSESPCHPAAAHTVRQRWRLEHSPTTALVSTVNADISNIVKSRCKKKLSLFHRFLVKIGMFRGWTYFIDICDYSYDSRSHL